MYTVDSQDSVHELTGLPQSSVGAPLPWVLADEHAVVVAYICEQHGESRDGTTANVVNSESSSEEIAIVRFACYAHFFGPPNDEAFRGHPLAERGLEPYGSFRVEDSSWIRHLERMNSVHPYHDRRRFAELHHYILSFHDSIFECVADSFRVETRNASLRSCLPRMAELISEH